MQFASNTEEEERDMTTAALKEQISKMSSKLADCDARLEASEKQSASLAELNAKC